MYGTFPGQYIKPTKNKDEINSTLQFCCLQLTCLINFDKVLPLPPETNLEKDEANHTCSQDAKSYINLGAKTEAIG